MINERDPAQPAGTNDARAWTQKLLRYREPSGTRSIVELVISAAPLAALWALMWLAYSFGFWWLSLLLAMPAAGFLVRLFMIQHDCGHGAFFRHRLANDWVGRVHRRAHADALRLLAAHPRHPPRHAPATSTAAASARSTR